MLVYESIDQVKKKFIVARNSDIHFLGEVKKSLFGYVYHLFHQHRKYDKESWRRDNIPSKQINFKCRNCTHLNQLQWNIK